MGNPYTHKDTSPVRLPSGDQHSSVPPFATCPGSEDPASTSRHKTTTGLKDPDQDEHRAGAITCPAQKSNVSLEKGYTGQDADSFADLVLADVDDKIFSLLHTKYGRNWSDSKIREASPDELPSQPKDHAKAIFSLFHKNDRVPCYEGRIAKDYSNYDSGNWHCRTAAQWMEGIHDASLIIPSTVEGKFSIHPTKFAPKGKFIVVCSSDHFPAPKNLKLLFPWLVNGFGLRLRAIVQVKGKPHEAWFDGLPYRFWKELETKFHHMSLPWLSDPFCEATLPDGISSKVIYLAK